MNKRDYNEELVRSVVTSAGNFFLLALFQRISLKTTALRSNNISNLIPIGLVTDVTGVLFAAGDWDVPLPVSFSINSTAFKL